MKILIVNVGSRFGSTGRIAYGLLGYLRSLGHDAKICCRGFKDDRANDEDIIKLCSKWEIYLSAFLSKLTGLEGHFNFISTRKLMKIIDKYQPDVVQLYNLHGYYVAHFRLLRYLKKHSIPVVYSMVDEYAYMGKCPYPFECEKFKSECKNCFQLGFYPNSWLIDNSSILFKKKRSLYEDFDTIVFTGPPYVCQRARESALLKHQKLVELDEPINVEEEYYPRDVSSLKKELGIKDDEIVILTAVSASSPRKGGQFFLEIAKRMENIPGFRFIYIGYDRNDWTFPVNMIVKGYVNSQSQMSEYYSLADLYLCTSTADTTPSVCLCALACGTPIAGFDYGGVRDCAPNEYGRYAPLKNIEALIRIVKNTPKKTESRAQAVRQYIVNRFSQKAVYSKQVNLYSTLLKDDN